MELFDRIEDKREDLIALTQDLVRVPTVNPPGRDYRLCAEMIGKRLAVRGFEVKYLRAEGTPGDSPRFPRENVVARWQGSRPGPCIHFNGHIDVVPAGEGWTFDPFAADLCDGKIYGRGTCDMKGGLAAAVIAAEALQEAFPNFPGAIEISGTADEESGGWGGVAFMAERGYFSRPRVEHVVIPEPLNVDRVCLGHRGAWWAEVETFGRIAHGAMPFLGDCAVRHMAAFMGRLEADLFPRLAARQTAMPVVPPGARSSTLNINALHGGLAEDHDGLPAPLVPDSCQLVLDRRFLIEESPEEVRREVVEILEALRVSRPGFRYAIKDIMDHPADHDRGDGARRSGGQRGHCRGPRPARPAYRLARDL